jgi:spermidine/putrescine transport system permease protein
MKSNKLHFLSYIFIGLVLAFIYIPLISMIVFSFNSSRSLTNFDSFTFKWYGELFTDSRLTTVIQNTFLISLTATFFSTILGTLAAISLSKQNKVFREIILGANNIPILSPDILTAVAFFVFLLALSIPRGTTAMILAHITISAPYAFLAVYPKVRSLDPNLMEAAADLGATPFKTLVKVILPQLRGAILAGAAIAFTMSFDDYIVSALSSGNMVDNISTYMYSQAHGIEPSINALSTLIVVAIGIKVVYDLIKSKKEKREE